MTIRKGVLAAIGNTPLVKLENLYPSNKIHVYAKLELLNPSGSAKDRPALRMIQEAWHAKQIGPDTVIIESSSGNLAISLAMICNQLGMRFISVIDPRTTKNNIDILQSFGAEIDYVKEPDPKTGEFLPARLNRVQELLAQIPNSFWPNQYGNKSNYLSHYETTMKEIVTQLGKVDYVFGAVSTCGTIRGCAEYVKDHGLHTKIVAVDAKHSAIFGGTEGKRRFPGLGAGIIPPFCKPEQIDHIVHVSDEDIVKGCRMLAEKESILAGASSGGVAASVKQIEQKLDPGSVCVLIMHDRGERYLDTVFSDDWVMKQFGKPVSSL